MARSWGETWCQMGLRQRYHLVPSPFLFLHHPSHCRGIPVEPVASLSHLTPPAPLQCPHPCPDLLLRASGAPVPQAAPYPPEPKHGAPPGTSVSSPLPSPSILFPIQLLILLLSHQRGGTGQALPAGWMLKASSGHREGKMRPRSRDGASMSSVWWKHHPQWALAGLHAGEPLCRPLGDQHISTGSCGVPCSVAQQMLLPHRPHKPDTQDTVDLSPCWMAAQGLIGDHTLQWTPPKPHTSPPGWGRAAGAVSDTSSHSPPMGGKEGSRRTEDDGERFGVVLGAKTWPHGT